MKTVFKDPRKPERWRDPFHQEPVEAGRPHKGDQAIRPAHLVRKGWRPFRPFKGGGRAMIAYLVNNPEELHELLD
jgi:hypothetical protein